jgi:hypothetical protein
MASPDRLREAIRARTFPSELRGDVMPLVRSVVDGGGESVLGVLFFGSRRTQASPDSWSGYDLFVLTREYREFYRSLRSAGALRRSPSVVAALNTILPPNQISVREAGESPALAKCAVISLATLLRETSLRRRDHFCVGRLFQPTEVLYARDAATAESLLDALVSAHQATLSWVRPWLPDTFDVETYCRTLLRVSLGREIRPEPEGRSDALWLAQKDYLAAVYDIVLGDLATTGELRTTGAGIYALARRVSAAERLRTTAYFRRSMLRATERWLKYMITFDDWLEYIVRKARRHSGEDIVLTQRERRLPIVFLWPRVIRYLRHKGPKAK